MFALIHATAAGYLAMVYPPVPGVTISAQLQFRL